MYCSNVKEVEAALSKINSGVVVLFVAEENFDFSKLHEKIENASIDVVGAKFPGVIHECKLYYEGYVLLHFEQEYDLRFFNSSKDVQELKDWEIKTGVGLIILDGLSSDKQEFLDELNYNIGADFDFIGSGAGSSSLKQTPCVFNKNGIHKDAAFVLLLDTTMSLGVAHGYERINGPIIATKVEKNVIIELNWETPMDVYSRYVSEHCGQEVNAENFSEWCAKYPLGINRKGQEDIVRDPIGCNEAGHIICIDEVPANAALYLLYGHEPGLISAAQKASKTAIAESKTNPELGLIVDCVTRVLYLSDSFDKEMGVIFDAFNKGGRRVPMSGLLSMGEISTYGKGRLEINNKAILSAVINE